MKAHPTAIVDSGADVADDVEIGPFCFVGPGVRLGSGCRLLARVMMTGPTLVGRNTVFHHNAVIGGPAQDPTGPAAVGRIEIGDDNIIREGVSVLLARRPQGATRLGSRNRLHYSAQVGPDVCVADDVVLGSFASLDADTVVEHGALIEGQGHIQSYVTIGRQSWVRSHTTVDEDVPPFMWGMGSRFKVMGVNPRRRTQALQRAFEAVWRSELPLDAALQRLEKETDPEVVELVAFLRRMPSRKGTRTLEDDGG